MSSLADEASRTSQTVDEVLAAFLAHVANPRTYDAYQRRLRETFIAMGITHIRQLRRRHYQAFTAAKPTQLFVPSGSVGAQSRAALRSFARWMYLTRHDELRRSLAAAICHRLNPRSPCSSASPVLNACAQAIAQRDAFAAALAHAALPRLLASLKVGDLLQDCTGDAWITADLPSRRGSKAIRGAWLCSLSPTLCQTALRSRCVLCKPSSGDALLLTASGTSMSARAVSAGIRRHRPQIPLQTTSIPHLPAIKGLTTAAIKLIECRCQYLGLGCSDLDLRTASQPHFWWGVLTKHRQSRLTPGVLGRLALELGLGVRALLDACDYPMSGLPRADATAPYLRLAPVEKELW